MKKQLSDLVEKRDSKAGLYFDYFIQILILISIITFSIETIPDLSDSDLKILNYIELICVVIFSFEYIVRLVLAPKKIAFIFSFYGIIDLLAILPFYLSFGIDLRSVRVLRFLRLFRLIKLARYNSALYRFSLAFKLIRQDLIMFGAVAIVLIYISAVGIYYFEHSAQPEVFSSIFSSLWWSVITLTTVGYGDVYPITIGGKIFTFAMLMVGLGIISIPSGMISSALTEARRIINEDKEDENNVENSN